MTDVAAGFEPLDVDLAEDGALCHKGVLEAAREVQRRLLEGEILKEAFKEKPEYRLVVTGHSLGKIWKLTCNCYIARQKVPAKQGLLKNLLNLFLDIFSLFDIRHA